MDRPWLQRSNAPGTLLSLKGLQAENTALHQVLWKHDALNLAFIAVDLELGPLQSVLQQVRSSVRIHELHIIVLGSTSSELHEGATFFKEKLPWAWMEIRKFSRQVSSTGGVHFQAWHLATTIAHTTQASPPKAIVTTRCLLAPG